MDELLAHADWVRMLSRALLADPNEADDVAQDAWVAALKRPPSAGDGLRGWWVRVVKSSAANRRRSELRRTDRERTHAAERTEATDPQVETTLDAHRRLVAALEALEEPLRRVIVEHYFHGSSSREIAEREGVADSTIRTRLQKALERLRRELDLRAGGDRQTWAMLLAPLAKLETRALPAAAAAVVIAGWIKLAAGLAFVGLAGVAAYAFLGERRAPPEFASSQPVVAASNPQPLSAPALESKREPNPIPDTVQAPVIAGAPEESVAHVEARVLDVHGLPIRSARLQCVDRTSLKECSDEDAPHGLADGNGLAVCSVRAADRSPRRASLAGLPKRAWYEPFEISARGHATRSVNAKIALGESTSLGDIVLEDGGDLAGRCLTSDGTPLASAMVTLLHADLSLEEREDAKRGTLHHTERLRSASSAADGSFSMSGAPTGQYRICATSENLATAISEPFVLAVSEERRIPDLILGACSGTIRGIVLNPDGTPCAKAQLDFTLNAAGDWGGANCAADGTFVLAGSSLAEVDVCAHVLLGDVGERLLRGVRTGETGVVLRLPEPRRFEVCVQDPSGLPVTQFSLDLKHSDVLDGNANYLGYRETPGSTLQLVASARPFVVRVEVDGYAPIEQGPFTQLDVPPSLCFRLQPSASVRGRVVLDGKPASSLRVHLSRLRSEPLLRADGMPSRATDDGECNTHADGSFAIGVGQAGAYVLCVQSRSGVVAFTRTLELAVGQPIEELLVELSATGAIAGRVTPTSETRARAAQVMYSCGLQNTRCERVLPDGSYRLDGLAPGTWWVRITPDVRPSSALLPAGTKVEDPLLRRIDVVAGSAASCDFDLGVAPPRRIDGRVLFDGKAPTTWTASVSTRNAAGDGYRTSAPIRADGHFELPIATFGDQALALRSSGRIDRDDCIEASLSVSTEGRRWTLACQLGTLEVEGQPGSECLVCAALSKGATRTTHAILDANGRATLDSLPAAKVRVSVAGNSNAPVEVEIPIHGPAQLRLP